MCDVVASSLMFIALTMVAASVYQMMRGGIVFVTAMMSILFLGRKLYRHHWTALALIIGGILIVGADSIFNKDDSDEDDTAIMGIILLIASQIAAGGLFIVEEKLLGNYYVSIRLWVNGVYS